MKIAMIGHKQIPGRSGGVEVVVEELSTRMAKNHEVIVFNRKSKEKIKLKKYKNVKINTVFTINKKNLEALIYSFFASIKVLFRKVDVIHYHALGPSVMLMIPKILKRNTKIVVTVHGLDYNRSKWNNIGSKYLMFGEKIIVKYADEIIVLSKNLQQYFLDRYNRKTIYIPNGIPDTKIRKPEIIKNKYNLDKNEYILFLSRIVPEKGLDYLLEAYEKLDTEKKLVIAGASSNTDKYVKEIKSKIKDNPNIIMTGFVSGNELDELYSNAYVFVLPSEIEGMPIVLLEALSYNIPILTSDIPENLEIVGEKNTFKNKNVDSLIEKLLSGVEVPNVNLSKYNWDEIVNKTIEIYESGKTL